MPAKDRQGSPDSSLPKGSAGTQGPSKAKAAGKGHGAGSQNSKQPSRPVADKDSKLGKDTSGDAKANGKNGASAQKSKAPQGRAQSADEKGPLKKSSAKSSSGQGNPGKVKPTGTKSKTKSGGEPATSSKASKGANSPAPSRGLSSKAIKPLEPERTEAKQANPSPDDELAAQGLKGAAAAVPASSSSARPALPPQQVEAEALPEDESPSDESPEDVQPTPADAATPATLAAGNPGAGSAGPWARNRGRLPTRPPTPQQVEARAAADAALEAREAEGDEPDPELASRPVPSEEELLEALQWAFQNDEVPPGVLPNFARHAHLVLETNRHLNLTGIVEAREVAVKHYLDSWRATRLLPLMGKHVVDLGSGAGFPGMPAALGEPNCRVTLVETRRKKADFLETAINSLGLKNAKAVWGRGEDFLATQRCDVVFIRALSSVRENVRMLRKVRHSFMDLVLFKGPSWSREVRASEREAERLGFRLDTVWEHELPGGMGQRALLVYRSPSAH